MPELRYVRYRTLAGNQPSLCGALSILRMPLRRVDDRIRHLSSRLTDATPEELPTILQTLLAAIHEKMERIRGLAVKRFLGGGHPSERRALPP